MCVMERVGVRELRQNLSVYLRRVQAGEALEVTEHGRPVAALVPIREPEDPIERLIAQGRITPGVGTIADIPMPLGPFGTEGTDALRADREGKE